jgi:hypothetical protein
MREENKSDDLVFAKEQSGSINIRFLSEYKIFREPRNLRDENVSQILIGILLASCRPDFGSEASLTSCPGFMGICLKSTVIGSASLQQ